ncbi:uncharacterized protein LOC135829222 [Sycon ciliatum]|uniref:uncharacterized protein LOC135829222 n=1 Tax=Sycon ciliatum TaxID=27933 RepID=UPI0031F5FCA0
MAEPNPKRFRSVSEEDLTEVLDSRVPAKTKEANQCWLSVFNTFNKKQPRPIKIEKYSKSELNTFLCKLYVAAKRQDGGSYQRSSYLCFRAALRRHVVEKRKWNIISDPEFARSNNCLDGVLKKLKREGELRPVNHKDYITDDDFKKLKDKFLRCKEPEVLVMEVWFYMTYHFALRGREIQRQVKKTDLVLKKDDNGDEYFLLNVDLTSKNHPGGIADRHDPPTAGRIQDGDQVFSVKYLLSRLHPQQEALFQKPKPNLRKGEQIWFENFPLGKNSLAQIMPKLSKVCGLSKTYTNHSVRATTVHRLSAAGATDRHIMQVTGHRNAMSLASYSKSTDEQQRNMAAVLDAPSSQSSERRQANSVPRESDERSSSPDQDCQEPSTSCQKGPQDSSDNITSTTSPALSQSSRTNSPIRPYIPSSNSCPLVNPSSAKAGLRQNTSKEVCSTFVLDPPSPMQPPPSSSLRIAEPPSEVNVACPRPAPCFNPQQQQQRIDNALQTVFSGGLHNCNVTINMLPYN